MIMEKKTYIAPAMEIAEIEMVEMLAASVPEIGVGKGDVDADDAWTNRRRGTWGNLWATDDEK